MGNCPSRAIRKDSTNLMLMGDSKENEKTTVEKNGDSIHYNCHESKEKFKVKLTFTAPVEG